MNGLLPLVVTFYADKVSWFMMLLCFFFHDC